MIEKIVMQPSFSFDICFAPGRQILISNSKNEATSVLKTAQFKSHILEFFNELLRGKSITAVIYAWGLCCPPWQMKDGIKIDSRKLPCYVCLVPWPTGTHNLRSNNAINALPLKRDEPLPRGAMIQIQSMKETRTRWQKTIERWPRCYAT